MFQIKVRKNLLYKRGCLLCYAKISKTVYTIRLLGQHFYLNPKSNLAPESRNAGRPGGGVSVNL